MPLIGSEFGSLSQGHGRPQCLGAITTPFKGSIQCFHCACCLSSRFTCHAECYTCHNCKAPVCSDSQTKGMFMVSAERVRTLPRSEYAWLRQWLHSWDGRGIQRRRVLLILFVHPASFFPLAAPCCSFGP